MKISESEPSRSHLLVPSPATTDGSIPERRYLVRGLVPHAASGTIIGHGGSIIRSLSEATGTKVQLADGQDPFHTKERIINCNTPSCEAAIRVNPLHLLPLVLPQNNIQHVGFCISGVSGCFLQTAQRYCQWYLHQHRGEVLG
jgi:hypothetical protein